MSEKPESKIVYQPVNKPVPHPEIAVVDKKAIHKALKEDWRRKTVRVRSVLP